MINLNRGNMAVLLYVILFFLPHFALKCPFFLTRTIEYSINYTWYLVGSADVRIGSIHFAVDLSLLPALKKVDDDDGNDGEWSIHEMIGNGVFSTLAKVLQCRYLRPNVGM